MPKSLVSIFGKPILEYQLNTIKNHFKTNKLPMKKIKNKKLILSIPFGILLIITEYKAQQETHPNIQMSPTTKFKEPKFRISPLIIIFTKPINEIITPVI